MIDWNKIKADTEAKQEKFGKFSLADIACFALIEAIDSMFSANARATQAEAELKESGAAYSAKCYTVTELQRINDELLAERDTAWAELREIREAINANKDESTADEVRRVVHERDELQARLNAMHSEYDELHFVREAETSRADRLYAGNVELCTKFEQAQTRIDDLSGQLAKIALTYPDLIKIEIAS